MKLLDGIAHQLHEIIASMIHAEYSLGGGHGRPTGNVIVNAGGPRVETDHESGRPVHQVNQRENVTL